jgi:hypothetical protein
VTRSSVNSWRFCNALLVLLVGGLFWSVGGSKLAAQEAVADESSAFQTQAADDHSQGPKGSAQQNASPGNKDDGGSFVIAFFRFPAQRWVRESCPVVAYIFPLNRTDKISPPSVLGAVGLITDNGIRSFVLGGELYFKENTYKMTAGYARGNLNYNLYGLGAGTSEPNCLLTKPVRPCPRSSSVVLHGHFS